MNTTVTPLSLSKTETVPKFAEGSVWRRWDLHIHSPATSLNNHFKGDWEAYISACESNQNIAVIGITDYLTIEGYKKVLEYKRDDRLKNISLILPNIEFRLTPETQHNKGINLHLLISPEDENHVNEIEGALHRLSTDFNGRNYSCMPQDLIALGKKVLSNDQIADKVALEKGTEQFKISFDKFKEWFNKEHWIKQNALVAVSSSSKDGASGVREDGFQELRKEIYRFSDIIFSGNPNECDYWLGKGTDSPAKIINEVGNLKPCIHGSDAHSIDKLFLLTEIDFAG